MPAAGILAVGALAAIGWFYVAIPLARGLKHTACIVAHGRKACKTRVRAKKEWKRP